MDSSTATLNDTSSDRAQRQLDMLRTAVDRRLAELEAVLADPMRGESLEGLILDLARVTTEEARTTALKAALDAKLEADSRVAHARAVAQEAIDEERVVAGELRRAVEQARQKIAGLEGAQLLELRRLREDLETEIGRERATAAGFERAASEAQRQLQAERAANVDIRQTIDTHRTAHAEVSLALEAEKAASAGLSAALEAERAASSELRLALERAQALTATLAREKAEAWTAQEALTADLSRERDTSARTQRLVAEAQAQLQLERAMSAELRRTAEETEQQLTNTSSDKAHVSASHEQLQREVEALRAESDTMRASLAAAGARLEMLDAERLRASATRKELEGRVEVLIRERESLIAERAGTTELPGEGATINAAPVPDAQPAKASGPVPSFSSISTISPGPAAEEEWGPVRLAVRYSFREPFTIMVNGDTGLLVDISVAGCQLVSSSAVRPNQAVKVLLPSGDTSLACTGKVMWARFEPRVSGGAFGYRAGVQFTKPDQPALEAFIASSRPPRSG
jgi:PilZ domain